MTTYAGRAGRIGSTRLKGGVITTLVSSEEVPMLAGRVDGD